VHLPLRLCSRRAKGHTLLAACEFSGDVPKIDLKSRKVTGLLHLGGMPQDVKLSPDGRVYYVADMMANGIHLIDNSGDAPKRLGFIATGKGAHGLYPTRDRTRLLITNRGEGTVSVLNFASRKLVARWRIPGGGSPDMGSVSANGQEFWVSGRYTDVVYVFDIRRGKLTHRIKVGRGPHGLTYFPQPGRYSLGHTSNYR
jgi:DNA-binding beta-propeller fold protein YncE